MVDAVEGARIVVLASQEEKKALNEDWSMLQLLPFSQACSIITPSLKKTSLLRFRMPETRSPQRVEPSVW